MIDFVDILQKLATGGAAATAAVVAVLGLRDWRTQLRGKTEYELSRRLLRATYRVRDRIQGVRAPFIPIGEIAQSIEEADKKFEDLEPEQRTLVAYDRRWRGVVDAWSDLEVERLEAEVLWGSDVASRLEPLRRRSREVFVALSQHADSRSTRYREPNPEVEERMRSVLWNRSSESSQDSFSLHIVTEQTQFSGPPLAGSRLLAAADREANPAVKLRVRRHRCPPRGN